MYHYDPRTPGFNHSKMSDDLYPKREHDNPMLFPVRPVQYASYPPVYPPQNVVQGLNHFELARQYPYPNFQNLQTIPQPQFNPYQFNPMIPIRSVDPQNSEILKEIAMLGRLIEMSPDRKVKSSIDRTKKITKDDREIKLGNIVFKPSRGDWQCKEKSCLNWNYAKREKCNKCGKFKDANKTFLKNEKKVSRKFWNCPECKFQNFEYKERCYKCGLRKKESEQISEKNEKSILSKTEK